MDKVFEVDSTAVLSKVSEAAVTHCRQKSEEGKDVRHGKGKRKEKKKTHYCMEITECPFANHTCLIP